MIKEKRELLDKVASELMTKESLDQDQFEAIVGPKKHKPEQIQGT